MNMQEVEAREKFKKDSAKKAVALAMQGGWEQAAEVNRAILNDFPRDLEAYNRLGKALSELGRNGEAKDAFHQALEISPSNTIAKKNLDRLTRLGDDSPRSGVQSKTVPHAFIEESGKAGVTSLTNLASPEALLKLAPGHPVELKIERGGLKVADPSGGENVGQVEPRLASRLIRLLKGGNRYDATVTSVGGQELTVIIREVFKHPSQEGLVSFPLRGGADYRVYLSSTLLGYEVREEDAEDADPVAVKDWSDDDTEPGDDDAFTPVLHRIINTGEGAPSNEDEGF